ncbi:SDR family NAD(P)-dependent oxidoreductase [Pseudochelatococcus sp. B33]
MISPSASFSELGPFRLFFVERAVASGYPGELSDADAPVVAEICRKVDGIALELAAARVKPHGLRETAELLDSRLKLLWKGKRTAQAQAWDFDVLWNNAGMGEAGPVWEIPIDLVRRNYEVNVFLPLLLTQGVLRRWVSEGKKGKVVFTSSMGGLFTPANWGVYVSTKHAIEAIAEALQQELSACGIKVQTINPGAHYTGYNETMADNPSAGWTTTSTSPSGRTCARASTISSPPPKARWTRRR